MRNQEVKVSRRLEFPVRRNVPKWVSDNYVVYNGSYPPDAFVNWGMQNITPFNPPDKPFSDLT